MQLCDLYSEFAVMVRKAVSQQEVVAREGGKVEDEDEDEEKGSVAGTGGVDAVCHLT